MYIKVALIFTIALTLVFPNIMYSEDNQISADKILRVGIIVDKKDLDAQMVDSDGNLSFYILANRAEIKLLDLGEKSVTFKKSNYHIKISDNLLTERDMQEALVKYKAIDSSVFPVYNGGWYIAYGSYIGESDGMNQLSAVKNKFSYSTASLYYSNKLVDVVGSKKLVSYNTSDGDFFVKQPTGSNIIKINDKNYRNGIGVIFSPTLNFTVLNIVNIDDYLYGVLPKEMSGSWPIEALKAQAIAARNFALFSIDKHKKYGYDVCATTNCQVYGGVDVEEVASNLAVDLTKGQLLMYGDDIVATYFHSNSGGRTESSENIWSGQVPYLRGVADEFSMFQPNSSWEKKYTALEASGILSKAGHDVGLLKDIKINTITENNRVTSVSFIGTTRTITLEKETIRSVFGYSNIKSIWYTIDKGNSLNVRSSRSVSSRSATEIIVITKNGTSNLDSNNFSIYDGQNTKKVETVTSVSGDVFVFKGFGYGHGLGMSQYGAKVMAERGFVYDDILKHYYSDTYLRGN